MEENNNTTGNTTPGTPAGETAETEYAARPPRRHRRKASEDKYFKIRNVLNIIFMVGAIAGMGIFYFHDRTMGTLVIITAMAFKIAECCFRFIRQ